MVNAKTKNKIYAFILRGNSIVDAAKVFNLSEVTIHNIIKKDFPHLRDVDILKGDKANVFESIQSVAISYILKKMPNATFKELITLLTELEDKIRLIRGQSTANMALNIRHESIISDKEKLESRLIENGVPKHLLEHTLSNQSDIKDESLISIKEAIPIPME